MENDGGLLTILESWLTTFVDGLIDAAFGAKTTDDLDQGSTNLYDNISWNQTTANGLYISAMNTSVATWNQGNSSWNQTLASSLYISSTNSSVATWNQVNGTWNETRGNQLYIGLNNASVSTWNQGNSSWNETKANSLYISATNASVLNQTATSVISDIKINVTAPINTTNWIYLAQGTGICWYNATGSCVQWALANTSGIFAQG